MDALRVLVIEDDAMVGLLLAEVLADLGYDVCPVAPTEDAAVAEADRSHPGLVIYDDNLQEGTGSGAMRRIDPGGRVPWVRIGGARRSFLPNNAPLCPEVLRKPFLVEDLIAAIRSALAVPVLH